MTNADFTGPDSGLLDAVVSAAARGGGGRAEVFVEDRSSLSLRLEDGKIEDAVSGVDRGASVRVIRGLRTEFGYVDSVDEGPLLRLAGELSGRILALARSMRLTQQSRLHVETAGRRAASAAPVQSIDAILRGRHGS